MLFKDDKYIASLPKVERPQTADDVARAFVREKEYNSALNSLQYGQGFAMVVQNVEGLFAEIEKQCSELAAHHRIPIEAGSQFNRLTPESYCTLRVEGYGMQVTWRQPARDRADHAELAVQLFQGNVKLPHEPFSPTPYFNTPKQLGTPTTYLPHLSPESDFGWARKKSWGDKAPFISNATLADQCIQDLLNLMRNPPRNSSRNTVRPPVTKHGSPWQ